MMRVKAVEYIEGYKLKLIFSDKTVKIVDLQNMIKKSRGIFLPLKDVEYFKKVTLDNCQLSICWPNGADICPDVLYAMGKEMKKTSNRTKSTLTQPRRH
jgi:hypothetical protein